MNLAVSDPDAARAALAEADSLPRALPAPRHPRRERPEPELPAGRGAKDRRVTVRELDEAELRLLPLLATHLSFREIAERLFVSRNAVKTQAISIYRKLGVSSRSQAIAHAHELGLVDPPATPHAYGGSEPERASA